MIEKKEKKVPTDDQSFESYIRSLTNRIRRLTQHLSTVGNHRDYQSRRLLERLIDKRGVALEFPPDNISRTCLESLRKEISNG